MTREELAAKLHWPKVVWFGGLVNVVALAPQLIKLIRTRETTGLAIEMFSIFLLAQLIFAVQGYFTRSKAQLITMLLSALETTAIILLITHLRNIS